MKFLNTPGIKFASVFFIGLFFSILVIRTAETHKKWNITFSEGDVIESAKGKMILAKNDFLIEPGEIVSHEELKSFFLRQDELSSILSAKNLIVQKNGQTINLKAKEKNLFELPGLFWSQLFVGLGAFILSGLIWSFRSKDLASTLFALSGAGMFMSALPSAIYTTRDLSLPMPLFQILEEFNALGASLFGITMVALFLVYPIRLKNWKRWALLETLVFGLWTILFLLKLTPHDLGISLIMFSEMLGICVAIGVQFFVTKRDPKSRAILTWLGLSVLLGAGGFIGLNTVPLLLQTTPLNQGYAFLFFLIIYLGLAAGIAQYRLFEVGQWAFKLLFYVTGAMVLVLLDAALIYLMGMGRLPALGVALLATGFFYLPLRDWLWGYFSKKKSMKKDEILELALHVAFAPTNLERSERWVSLLKKLFDPLEMNPLSYNVTSVEIDSDGLTLFIPPIASSKGLSLKYPWSGRSLFNVESQKIASQLVSLIEKAESNREAYDRGVVEERRRMAQDLHDDVGARLLTGLYLADEKLKPTLQGAISDIRSIVSGMSGEEINLGRLLADLRYESSTRLSTSQIQVSWPIFQGEASDLILDYRQHKALSSAIREIVSNVIRHSEARSFEARIETSNQKLHMIFSDNGKGIPERILKGEGQGHGLKNLHRRMNDINAELMVESLNQGSRISLKIPLEK